MMAVRAPANVGGVLARRTGSEQQAPEAGREPLEQLVARLGEAGVGLTVELPSGSCLRAGPQPDRTRVVFHSRVPVDALLRGNHLALAESYLTGEIDVEGELRPLLQVTDHLDLVPARWGALGFWLRFLLDRRRFNLRSISFHYDRPPDFFLDWLGPARCYTHGFYTSSDEPLARAEARKLQYAIDALGLKAGDRALDMGCGWGSFLEVAGRQGIEVHGITISREQHDFVSARIAAEGLPCRVELVDFLDFRPERPFDAAIFMGSLEHMPGYRRLSRFLERHLVADGSVYADFVTSREGRLAGAFLRKHIFPGVSGYVDLPGLVRALGRAGLNVSVLEEDTLSCACTVRDWAQRLERHRGSLAERYGEPSVRAFLLYLWGSCHFLETNRTQAYHLVAHREPAGLHGSAA